MPGIRVKYVPVDGSTAYRRGATGVITDSNDRFVFVLFDLGNRKYGLPCYPENLVTELCQPSHKVKRA